MNVNGIDKILMVNKFECVIYLKYSPTPVRLYCTEGKVEIFLDWFLQPNNIMSSNDHKLAYLNGTDDTQIIELRDIA